MDSSSLDSHCGDLQFDRCNPSVGLDSLYLAVLWSGHVADDWRFEGGRMNEQTYQKMYETCVGQESHLENLVSEYESTISDLSILLTLACILALVFMCLYFYEKFKERPLRLKVGTYLPKRRRKWQVKA